MNAALKAMKSVSVTALFGAHHGKHYISVCHARVGDTVFLSERWLDHSPQEVRLQASYAPVLHVQSWEVIESGCAGSYDHEHFNAAGRGVITRLYAYHFLDGHNWLKVRVRMDASAQPTHYHTHSAGWIPIEP